jgi:hypothetical protein
MGFWTPNEVWPKRNPQRRSRGSNHIVGVIEQTNRFSGLVCGTIREKKKAKQDVYENSDMGLSPLIHLFATPPQPTDSSHFRHSGDINDGIKCAKVHIGRMTGFCERMPENCKIPLESEVVRNIIFSAAALARDTVLQLSRDTSGSFVSLFLF